MRILLVLFALTFIMSCGKSNEEQMMYTYEAALIKEFLGADLND